MKRLPSRVVAVVMAAAVLASVGVSAAPAQAQECPPETGDVCRERTELEDFTLAFLGDLRVNVTEPSQPAEGAIAEFVAAVLNALNSREQAILSELNGMRVAEATAALRGVMTSRNMLRDPNPSVRNDFVRVAAEAAYRAESLLVVSSGDPEAVDELGQVGMAAYALYVTGTVAADETLPQPDADEELILVLEEYLRFLRLLLDLLLGGGTADAASEAEDAIEEAVEQVRNRDPGEGGPGSGGVLEYVALGDSYASGTGAQNYNPVAPAACRRSLFAYPALLDGAVTPRGQVLRSRNVACHGATTEDYVFRQAVPGVEGPQRIHLSNLTTGLVTVSMGGNDLHFPDIVAACLVNLAGFCGVGEGNLLVPLEAFNNTQENLRLMYTNILNSIRPDGQLVVITYPIITPSAFPDDNPCWITDKLISPAELAMIAQFGRDVGNMIHRAVNAVGSPRIRVVDMADAFVGHEICTNNGPWANALRPPNVPFESFHPNAAGHQQYARLIARELGLTGVSFP